MSGNWQSLVRARFRAMSARSDRYSVTFSLSRTHLTQSLFSPLSLAHATLTRTALIPTVANIGLQLYLGYAYACFRAVGEPPAQPSAVAPAAGRPAPGAELQTVPTAVAVGVPVSTAVPATAC
jgi:hypothetical protein